MDFVLVLLINVIRIYKWAIIARVLISWVQGPGRPSGPTLFLHQATEPMLRIFRGILPRTGMIDLSPLIAFIALDFAQLGLVGLLADF